MANTNPGHPDSDAAPTGNTFAERLMLARARAGRISIRRAATMTGLNRGAWEGWENGRTPRDQVNVCHRIADVLGVDFTWLLFGNTSGTVDAGPHTDEATALAALTAYADIIRFKTQADAAGKLRAAAAGRRTYAENAPDHARETLLAEAVLLELAARVAAGDLEPLYGWLPTWQWTDEMMARLKEHDAET